MKAARVKRVILATGENRIHTPDDPVWELADGVEPMKVPNEYRVDLHRLKRATGHPLVRRGSSASGG